MTSDILIIGGGVIGLATAIELKLRGAKVTAISRNRKAAAATAAAGMLAPSAERIADTAMLQLCNRSLYLYPDWTRKLEEITGLDTGYWACGILAPVYEGQGEKFDNSSHSPHSSAEWLDKQTIHQYQPGLSEEVIGGWWYPEDAQVDNRALFQTLLNAAQNLGVEIQEGITVKGIIQQQGEVKGLQTNAGRLCASKYVLATGAWCNELLPLPLRPVKGQMLSIKVPFSTQELPLSRVLYGENIYIVPRRDGRIIIGATCEDVGFTPGNTPIGIQSLLQAAIRLYPQLQNYPIEELWWGFRPTTPDELPILGNSWCKNLIFATGHHRNGILLAPITAKLIADIVLEEKSDSIFANFDYSRFHNSTSKSTAMPTSSVNFSNGNISSQSLQTNQVVKSPNEDLIQDAIQDSKLIIAGKEFTSRLMTGTGKYKNIVEMQQSVDKSECQIVTVAVRRVQTNAPGHEGLAEALDWNKIWMLPNTAGCKTADEAIRVARLGREMAKILGQEDNNFVKLEVIPDAKYLLPDPIGTLQAAEQLVKEGFAVLPYINADPMLAKRLEEVGCATVMPLAAPIGSGQGLQTTANIKIIIENANIPVVVDAGIGAPSEAAQAMEMGADALLINSAIALANNPPAMARAMNMAAVAGRLAYLAGRMPMKDYASPSSPLTGTVN
ncbi:glycine oxidase [Rivularia sp. PCC 7116]|uniref:glycine oxidase ThiO n=1 Tax=Rivularia sp. PCC 7116 TaxID=373994 RepID=UPI00029EC606|nr:glycine oxidase ThiO [Rivularia sp. PCC 7116]AFY54874.1 glycine oxidase [Rivularia sp. PCC 7116]